MSGNYIKKLNTCYEEAAKNGELLPNKFNLYFDFACSLLLYGSTISDYFQYRFWEKKAIVKKEFMTARKNNEFYAAVNDRPARSRLNHKAQFNSDFRDYLKRDTLAIPGTDFEEFKKFAQEKKQFFVKPCKLGAGVGVTKYNTDEIKDIKALYDSLQSAEYVIAECISQDEIMASIHPESINTCRIITFFDNKDVKIIGAVMRCGVGKSYIDNHSAGGLTATVDVESGKIVSCASNKFHMNVVRHPDTGIIFPGFQIPYWDQAKEMVLQAAATLNGIHYVGWDVAFIPGGVCLIEANPSGDPVVLQEPSQRGVKSVFDKMQSTIKQP